MTVIVDIFRNKLHKKIDTPLFTKSPRTLLTELSLIGIVQVSLMVLALKF